MRSYNSKLHNDPVDVSEEFVKLENDYFFATKLTGFDTDAAEGILEWRRHNRKVRMAFNQMNAPFAESESWEFPPEYPRDEQQRLSVSFVTPRTVRIRISPKHLKNDDAASPMLAIEPGTDDSWKKAEDESAVTYTNSCGSIIIGKNPWYIEFRDANGQRLTRTLGIADTKALLNSDPVPFAVVRRAADLKRMYAATFALSPGEKIYGCGESFTRLDKRGQKIVLWTSDALSVQTGEMYKPVPFFMSSRGFGMFTHTSAPLTYDFGSSYDGAATIYSGDDSLDLFFFFGTPKEILSEYTALTGRSPLPPLWSFGLWMSRITYRCEDEVRSVAAKLRERKIPCDVIHIDTGWFETEWRCDYRFSTSRFKNPAQMLEDLKKQGFRLSLWQLPYFLPQNELYRELCDKNYVVRDGDGNLPTEDAIIDFTNPDAVTWYQNKLAGLLNMGVSAIKADFGEGAPLKGIYHSGKSGFYEHNLYPLRYNKVVAEITRQVTGVSIIWARSAWAGSQRYPVHWGGDAENTDNAMAATLRAGLSLGLCGFSFWSHDIGGFVKRSPEELYNSWMPFGMLTSHSRCHGEPPKEPWEYSDTFEDGFRRSVELKYRLIPYIYAQAKICSDCGFPMIRPLFFEYPEDVASWFIEDEYLLGRDLLVAPLFHENNNSRNVYLPPGKWFDYQNGAVYDGGRWCTITAGDIPVILLARNGSVIPHIGLCLSTAEMNWEKIDLYVYDSDKRGAEGYICFPDDQILHTIPMSVSGSSYSFNKQSERQNVIWKVCAFEGNK